MNPGHFRGQGKVGEVLLPVSFIVFVADDAKFLNQCIKETPFKLWHQLPVSHFETPIFRRLMTSFVMIMFRQLIPRSCVNTTLLLGWKIFLMFNKSIGLCLTSFV